MTPTQKKRLLAVFFILSGIGITVALGLTALSENLLYFYSPSQVVAGEAPPETRFRLGGMVVENSVKRQPDSVTVTFELTDYSETIPVTYNGILPDLFREGQGIVTHGAIDAAGIFVADEVLAKHDEEYMPPEVADAIAESQGKKEYTGDGKWKP